MSRHLLVLTLSALTGCGGAGEAAPAPAPVAAPATPAAKSPLNDFLASDKPERADPSSSGRRSGKVLEAIPAPGYTYVKLGGCGEEVWLAGPATELKVGDTVVTPGGAAMPGFKSKTLDRTFDMIYFVSEITVAQGEPDCSGSAAAAPATEPAAAPHAAPTASAPIAITPAAGETPIADVYAKRAELAGTSVRVHGKVTKFSANIMGTNWIHLQDGSGDAGAKTNDLTIRTKETVAVDQEVVLEGVLASDKDFGAGYRYDAILEEAKLVQP